MQERLTEDGKLDLEGFSRESRAAVVIVPRTAL